MGASNTNFITKIGGITMTLLKLFLVGLGIASLAGCAGIALSPVSPTTVSSSPVPRATNPPTTPVPAEIVIGAEATEIVDASGAVLLSIQYSDDADAAVQSVVDLLRASVETGHRKGFDEGFANDWTDWGGFEIYAHRYPEENLATGADRAYQPAFTVRASAAATDAGVSIRASDGTRVGDSFEAATVGKSAAEVQRDASFGVNYVALALPASFPGIVGNESGGKRAYGVIASAEADADNLETIVAPSYNYFLH